MKYKIEDFFVDDISNSIKVPKKKLSKWFGRSGIKTEYYSTFSENKEFDMDDEMLESLFEKLSSNPLEEIKAADNIKIKFNLIVRR